jgi:hypothetical protein
MNTPRGHWFCSHCDDMVTLPLPWGRWDARRGVLCPVCHHTTADWIPAQETTTTPAAVAPEVAKEFFRQMHEAAEI